MIVWFICGLIFTLAVASITWIMTPNGCWHDWVVVELRRQSDIRRAEERAVTNRPIPPGVDFVGEPYFETRVCLKCHVIDDQIERERQRIRQKLKDDNLRLAEAEAVLGASRGKTCRQTLDNYSAAMEIIKAARK